MFDDKIFARKVNYDSEEQTQHLKGEFINLIKGDML